MDWSSNVELTDLLLGYKCDRLYGQLKSIIEVGTYGGWNVIVITSCWGN
ncbi:hypothetical protein [Candidatus Hodgkinia cicadicola]